MLDRNRFLISSVLCSVFAAHGVEKAANSAQEVINLQNLQEVIKRDGLQAQAQEKLIELQNNHQNAQVLQKAQYAFPDKFQFYRLAHELWLVRNYAILRWDFQRPSYGLVDEFTALAKQLGFIGLHFHVLVHQNTSPAHLALPIGENEYIFLISLPFIKSLDLARPDIALLMLEDFFRGRKAQLEAYVSSAKLMKKFGTNFMGGDPEVNLLSEYHNNLSKFVFDKGGGFSVTENFAVTQEMKSVLKAEKSIFQRYLNLVNKVDFIVKTNVAFRSYSSFYPSPELKRGWLQAVDK